MGYSCCVPNCRTGYRPRKGEPIEETSLTRMFAIPQDQRLRRKWIRAISRRDFAVTKYTKVCGKHFSDSDFVEDSHDTNLTRRKRRQNQKLSRSRLKPGVVPRIFRNLSDYTNSPSCKSTEVRASASIEKQDSPIKIRINHLFKREDIETLASHEHDMKSMTLSSENTAICANDSFRFRLIETSNLPKLEISDVPTTTKQPFLPSNHKPSIKHRKPETGLVSSSVFQHEELPMTSPRTTKKSRNSSILKPAIETLSSDHSNDLKSQTELGNVRTQYQLAASTVNFSLKTLMEDNQAFHYFTGFHDIKHFLHFIDIVTCDLHLLEYNCVSIAIQDQIFMTLIKLRQSLDDQLLGYMFQVPDSTVPCIITAWIKHMYFLLAKLPIWPSKRVISNSMPDIVQHVYPSTRVIIGSTEIPIEKPSDIHAQSVTFSAYKNRNTMKVLIAVTPKGAVSYISDCYGGSVSDRTIIEQSDLLADAGTRFERGDIIMAYRSILVQDLFAPFGVKVEVPPSMKGLSRVSQEHGPEDCSIPSNRVCVEAVISYAKTFKIIQSVLPTDLLYLGNQIVFICFILINFRKGFV